MRELRDLGFTSPEEEYILPGHMGCAGCGAAHAMRYALKALGSEVVGLICAGCWSGMASGLKIAYTHVPFMTAGASASGVRAALDARGDHQTTVLAWAGDGGTFDIGLQSLSGAAERNEDFIYVCYDNEAYMNTGIQRSSATPVGTWTTTTPAEQTKVEPKKDIGAIMASHRIPYVATATIGYPEDLMRKMAKAKEMRGTRFIHLLAPCPTGWRFPSAHSIKISRLAVESKVFPLYEVEGGLRYNVQRPRQELPVSEYLRAQGRFASLTEPEMLAIQANVDTEWQRLLEKEKVSS